MNSEATLWKRCHSSGCSARIKSGTSVLCFVPKDSYQGIQHGFEIIVMAATKALDYLCPGTSRREEGSSKQKRWVYTEQQEASELLSHSWARGKYVWNPGDTLKVLFLIYNNRCLKMLTTKNVGLVQATT